MSKIITKRQAILLDGRMFTSKEAVHEILKDALSLPQSYGKNLDALFDCLTEEKRTETYIYFASNIEENLGEYGQMLLRVLKEANEYGGMCRVHLIG